MVGGNIGVGGEEGLNHVSVGSGHHGHILSISVHSLHPSDDDDNPEGGGHDHAALPLLCGRARQLHPSCSQHSTAPALKVER